MVGLVLNKPSDPCLRSLSKGRVAERTGALPDSRRRPDERPERRVEVNSNQLMLSHRRGLAHLVIVVVTMVLYRRTLTGGHVPRGTMGPSKPHTAPIVRQPRNRHASISGELRTHRRVRREQPL